MADAKKEETVNLVKMHNVGKGIEADVHPEMVADYAEKGGYQKGPLPKQAKSADAGE